MGKESSRNKNSLTAPPPGRGSYTRRLLGVAKESFWIFYEINAATRGAAIAFYAVTSIVPVLIIVIAAAGAVFGHEAASGAVFSEFQGLLGSDGAEIIQKTILSASDASAGTIAGVISVVTLLLTVSGVFLELQDALNAIWKLKPRGGILSQMARARALGLGLVVATGFLLIISLIVDAALKGLATAIDSSWPAGSLVLISVNSAMSYVTIALLFAAILRFLPAHKLAWSEVTAGAAFTALLFEFGKFLIGLYLGSSTVLSSLGAAGAFLAMLFWVYYSAQIFLLGAAATRAYSHPGAFAADRNETVGR